MTNRQERIEELEQFTINKSLIERTNKSVIVKESELFDLSFVAEEALSIIKDLQEEIKKLNDLVDLFSKERLS